MELQAGLVSFKTALEIVKMLHASNKSLADAETKHRIASLMTALADAQIQYSELTMQLDKRDETIRELTDQLNIKTKLSYEQPCYWFVDGDIRDGPYCQLCWDDQGKLIRLSDLDGDEYFRCKKCNKWFRKDNRVKEVPPARRNSWMTS